MLRPRGSTLVQMTTRKLSLFYQVFYASSTVANLTPNVTAFSSAAVLGRMQAVIGAATRNQFLMRTLFQNAAFIDHDDTVSALDGGKPVRDDQRRAADGKFRQRA